MRAASCIQRLVIVASAALLVGWTPVEEGAHPRSFTTMSLLPDGKVLVAGGAGPDYNAVALVDVYDPYGRKFLDGWPPLSDARLGATSVVLEDGRIFVIGGASSLNGGSVTPVASAEVFDPWSKTWTTVAPPPVAATKVIAVLLPDGRVLVKPISPGLDNSFIYDPVANAWTTTSPGPDSSSEGSGIRLINGQALFLLGPWPYLYYPTSDMWTNEKPAGSFTPLSRLVPLADGRAFHVARNEDTQAIAAVTYEPQDDLFGIYGSAPSELASSLALADTLSTGEVLVAVPNGTKSASGLFRPKTNDWVLSSPPAAFDGGAQLIALRVDDSALLMDASGAQRYERTSVMGCTVNNDCGSGFCVNGQCCESPCTAPCYSCIIPGYQGQCIAEPQGMDLHGDCSSEMCVATCDGHGQCVGTKLGDVCALGGCIDDLSAKTAAFCREDGRCATNEVFTVPCAPYRCSAALATCTDHCVTNSDCAPGYGCNHEGRCVEPPRPQYGGCTIAASPFEEPVPWFVLACGAAWARRRSRTGRRQETKISS